MNQRYFLTGVFVTVFFIFDLVGCTARQAPSGGGPEQIGLPRFVVLVRHAERPYVQDTDPSLTPEGVERAHALAAALRDAGITAIITTELRRMRETAEPLATALGITPEIVPQRGLTAAALAEALAAAVRRHKDGKVLVVGNNSVTLTVGVLGGPRLPGLCQDLFADLFVFVPAAAENGLLHLRYGAVEKNPKCQKPD